MHEAKEIITSNFLPQKQPIKILITSGASCPDALVEAVIRKLGGFYNAADQIDNLIHQFSN